MSAIEIFGVFLFLIFVVSCIGMFVFLATWVYKDAKARGLNAPLWTIIVILAGQKLIGLLLYLLIGRKESKITCPECSEKTSEQAKFCDKCGKPVDKDLVSKPKSQKKWLVALLVAFIITVVSGIGTAAVVLNSGYQGKLPGNVSIGKTENRFGNKWKVTAMRSNETLSRTVTIRNGGPDTLTFSGSCQEGSMVLVITYEDTILTYELSDQTGETIVDLSDFDTNNFRMTLINSNAKNVKFRSSWE